MERRKVLQGAGAIAAVAATGGFTMANAGAAADEQRKRGMAHGLTILNLRRNGAYELAVKTDKGILVVPEAAKLLKMHAPATVDDLLQHEDGPSLNALVDAALKSSSAHSAFIKEDGIEYGPVVTHPEKIVCVGLNYRKHAQEIGSPIPKAPVLFNKFNVALNHHKGTVKLPVEYAKKFDYECRTGDGHWQGSQERQREPTRFLTWPDTAPATISPRATCNWKPEANG